MANGRQYIGSHDNFVECFASRHMSWPVHHSWNMHAAIEGAEFIAAKWCIVSRGRILLIQPRTAFRGGAIVAKDKDQGIVALSRALQRFDYAPDCVIRGREHRCIHLAFLWQIREALDVLLRRMHRIVYGVERGIQEKGFIAIRPDEANRLISNPF